MLELLEWPFTIHAMVGSFWAVKFGLTRGYFIYMLLGNVYWATRWIVYHQNGALALITYYAAMNLWGIWKYSYGTKKIR